MGNQGTTNWKFTAFFAISLMLIAGLFTNAAIAGNGDGTLTVGWAAQDGTLPTDSYNVGGAVSAPLPAGSIQNQLKFTYTVPATISMAGGKLEIMIPSGWKPLKMAADHPATTDLDETTLYANVTVSVNATGTATAIYTTTDARQGAPHAGAGLTAAQIAAIEAEHGKFAISDTKIEVTLGSAWFNGGTVTITLGNVQTAIPDSLRVAATGSGESGYPAYTAYTFEARSMERNGRLVRLKPSATNQTPQPRVRVGNILGTNVGSSVEAVADTTSREVTVTPATSYPGETHDYIVTFTAPGPMYGHALEVRLPPVADLTLPTGKKVSDQVSVRAPGALISFDPRVATNLTATPPVYGLDTAGTGRSLTIGLTRINKGQKVTVTLRGATVVASEATLATAVSEFRVSTRSAEGSQDVPVTKITGGAFALLPGSGKIAASPDSAKANAIVSRLTITYTASTSLKAAKLQITVPDGFKASASTGEADLDADDEDTTLSPTFHLQATDSSKKGYISSPDSKGAAPVIGYADADRAEGTPTTITWNSVTLAKDKTFRTYIDGVRVQNSGGLLPITAKLVASDGSFTDAGADSPPDAVTATDARFYVVVTDNEDVVLTSDKHFVRAASLETLTFTFTADDTPLRNGKVQFNIPSGWSAPMKGAEASTDVEGSVTVGGTAGARFKEDLSVSGRSITVAVPNADTGQTVIVTYGGTAKKAKIQTRAAKSVKINGYYWASSGSPRRGAGTVDIEVGNANDGTGKGTITPTVVTAGSIDETFTIKYVAAGTMDGGQVSLERPAGWGDFSSDPATLNYVRVTASGGATIEETDNGGSIIIVTLDKCPPNGTITFVYGTGTGAKRGARAQDATGVAEFTLKSQGDEFGALAAVMGDRAKAKVTADDPKYLGETFTDVAGMLRVDVTGADDGRGTGAVTLVKSKAGDGAYTAEDGVAVTEMRVHAADDETHIDIVYTATETIENGSLKFTAPAGWTKPQGSDPGSVGFTSVQAGGGASIGSESYATAATDLSLEVPVILMNASDTITIRYGETAGSGGGAVVPGASGTYTFMIETKGGDADTNVLKAIRGTVDGDPLTIKVYSQASGGGSAAVTAGASGITAGGSAEVTVVYTAAGDISSGMLKLTTPANWSHPLMSNVAITSTGSIGAAAAGDFGGYYVGDPDDAADDKTVPTGGPGAKDVHVDSVNLKAGETVTFVYSATMVQAATGDATFAVAVDGGAGPATGAAAVSAPEGGTLTVTVGEAAAGSGMASVDLGGNAVVAGSAANELIFNYTAVGTIGYPREIRVTVPASWFNENDDNAAKGTYTVALADKDGRTRANVVETLAAVGMDLVVRVRAGTATVNAGDVVSITYTAADAPRATGNTAFKVLFDGMQVGSDLNVLVGSGKPATALTVTAPASHLSESTTPAMLTVRLDEDGNDAPAKASTVVSLSSDSSTGSFTVGGAAATTVTIAVGTSTAMASYSDSSLGDAVLTASSGTLTAGTATINVTTENVMVTSVSFAVADSEGVAKTVARDGDTVTVTAMGTQSQTAMVTIGTIVVSGSMDESATSPGTYTRSHTLAAGSPEGDHAVSVTIGSASRSATAMLTVDNTAPTISASSASPDTVANGDTVTISASISGATSVMANVSLLDIGAASVTLTDADADGTYTGTHTISDTNTAANGAQLITITAMDDAGNSSDATASVTLQNAISFTSTLPQGISLFHVPLDEEGLDTVGDLETKLGDSANLLITYDGTSWNSRSSGVAITASLGILVSMSAETAVTFEGQPWSDTTISVAAGSNLIGLPVNDSSVTMASQIGGLFATGTVSSVIVASGGSFKAATAADDAAVAGDAAYLVIATAAGSATLSGAGWSNDTAGAAPIALAGYTVDNQTPVLDVHGSVVDEITGIAKEGFRVKVKNLSTKAALSEITSEEAADGYNMTFVDLADSYAARVGDVLEISADSPNPLIGVQPVRHIVTVDDVKNSTIQLENLIAYEIPAETELLRNYPNPFNPETWIPYHLSEDADVKLTIYDINGEVVRDIDVGHQTAAKYDTRSKAIYWDGRNRFGEQVASGIYFYHLQAGDFSGTRKMVILK